jgi:hypothetical protein
LKGNCMKNIAILFIVGALIALGAMAGRPTKAADVPAAASKVRIGVYDSRAVALAWGRSSEFTKGINERMAEHKKAKAEGNDKLVKEIEGQMSTLQDKMHWQVFGDWNIDEVLAKIKPNYPAIAQKTGVVAIVPRAEFKDVSVETVDVTELMVAQFAPDDKTKAIMKEMTAKPPLAFEELRKVRTKD